MGKPVNGAGGAMVVGGGDDGVWAVGKTVGVAMGIAVDETTAVVADGAIMDVATAAEPARNSGRLRAMMPPTARPTASPMPVVRHRAVM